MQKLPLLLYYLQACTIKIQIETFTWHIKNLFSEIPFQKGLKYDVESPEMGIQAGMRHRRCLIPTNYNIVQVCHRQKNKTKVPKQPAALTKVYAR